MKKILDSTKREKVLIVDHNTEGYTRAFSNSEEFRNAVLKELDEDVIEVKIVKRKKTE